MRSMEASLLTVPSLAGSVPWRQGLTTRYHAETQLRKPARVSRSPSGFLNMWAHVRMGVSGQTCMCLHGMSRVGSETCASQAAPLVLTTVPLNVLQKVACCILGSGGRDKPRDLPWDSEQGAARCAPSFRQSHKKHEHHTASMMQEMIQRGFRARVFDMYSALCKSKHMGHGTESPSMLQVMMPAGSTCAPSLLLRQSGLCSAATAANGPSWLPIWLATVSPLRSHGRAVLTPSRLTAST